MASVATADAAPTNVGGALGRATSFCQPRATSPLAVRTIIRRNTATTAIAKMPRRSAHSRRQAARQTPSERGALPAPGATIGGSTALIGAPRGLRTVATSGNEPLRAVGRGSRPGTHLSTTLGSTSL